MERGATIGVGNDWRWMESDGDPRRRNYAARGPQAGRAQHYFSPVVRCGSMLIRFRDAVSRDVGMWRVFRLRVSNKIARIYTIRLGSIKKIKS
jgi:hypothetical protein